jgi:hypothetical protein
MAQISRAHGTRAVILAVVTGVALAAALDAAENYAFVHLISHDEGVVALSYLLVGLVAAAPLLLVRPRSMAVPLVCGLLAVPAFFCGDLAYVIVSSYQHRIAFDFLDYLDSYAEFQQPYTIRLELLAPAGALTLAWLRYQQVRSAVRRSSRHRTVTGHQPRSVALARPHHAEVD